MFDALSGSNYEPGIAMPCLITGKHSVYASLRKVFDQITSLYDENVDGYELALKALLLQAIFLLLQYSKKITKKEKEQHSEKLKSVLDYIGEHYAEPISIAELAELCYFVNIILCVFQKCI